MVMLSPKSHHGIAPPACTVFYSELLVPNMAWSSVHGRSILTPLVNQARNAVRPRSVLNPYE